MSRKGASIRRNCLRIPNDTSAFLEGLARTINERGGKADTELSVDWSENYFPEHDILEQR
jgi:hypothetical protein